MRDRNSDALDRENVRRLWGEVRVIKETVNCKIRFICDDWLPSSFGQSEMFSEFQSALHEAAATGREYFAAVALRRSECDYNKFLAKSRPST